jgi:hypothetical protein
VVRRSMLRQGSGGGTPAPCGSVDREAGDGDDLSGRDIDLRHLHMVRLEHLFDRDGMAQAPDHRVGREGKHVSAVGVEPVCSLLHETSDLGSSWCLRPEDLEPFDRSTVPASLSSAITVHVMARLKPMLFATAWSESPSGAGSPVASNFSASDMKTMHALPPGVAAGTRRMVPSARANSIGPSENSGECRPPSVIARDDASKSSPRWT